MIIYITVNKVEYTKKVKFRSFVNTAMNFCLVEAVGDLAWLFSKTNFGDSLY